MSAFVARLKLRAFLFSLALVLVMSSHTAFGYVVDGEKWGDPTLGTGATITWSIMGAGNATDDGPFSSTALSTFLPIGWEAAIEAAFDSWSAVANLTFVNVGDCGNPIFACDTGDIRIGGHAFDGPNGTLAHGFVGSGAGYFGDIHLDEAETWKIGFGGSGFDITWVVAHEIGHSIGLGHTMVPGSLLNAFYTEAFQGPQADDIAGAVYLYGLPVVVPVPASLPLFFSALVAFGLVARRKRPTAAT